MKIQTTFQHLENVNPHRSDEICVIGRQADGKSVCARVTNVEPHVCVKNTIPTLTALQFETFLNEQIHRMVCSSKVFRGSKNKVVPNYYKMWKNKKDYVTVEEFYAQDIMNYDEKGAVKFFRCVCRSKRYLYDLKRVLKNQKTMLVKEQIGVKNTVLRDTKHSHFVKSKTATKSTLQYVGYNQQPMVLYNDQVDFMLQYFIDNDISSCSWLECVGEKVPSKISSCDIEIFVDTLKETKSQGMAPWRIFSYDIESLPRPMENRVGKFHFPTADKDPVVTIGGILQIQKELHQFVWILRPAGHEEAKSLPAFTEAQDCDYKPEITTVFDFDNEATMIDHFFSWCIEMDVDLIQGHNCNRFDNTYMVERYNKIFDKTPLWGRLTAEASSVEEKSFNSNQKGTNKQYKLHLPGRVVFDSYDIFKDQHNEASYKLDDLAATYLGTKKVPMDYADIYPKFHTLEGRIDLAVYCVKDAWLVYKLLDKLCKLTTISQMSSVTGVSMKDVLHRGQGIRTIALMLRYARKREIPLMMPRIEHKTKTIKKKQFVKVGDKWEMKNVDLEVESSFKGAVVVDPDPGFYTDAVSCLDFASLYPSIMQAMNMSHETLCYRPKIQQLGWEEDKDVRTIPDYDLVDGKLHTKINPTNPSFVMKNKRVGLLPEILDSLLSERKRVKKLMKTCTPHSVMYNVHNGTQLALKVSCNSIYGFCGASFGFLPCKEIASSVTKYGRGLTLKTKSIIENHPEWGREGHGCKCIYGDTDSVFVHMPRSLVNGANDEETVEKAHKMGEVMADYVTKFFLPPVFLEYEKTYLPYLLLKKKRYAGMKNEPGLPQKLHIKGLESVRRDFAPLLVETQKKVLDCLIRHKSKEKACEVVKDVVQKLHMNQIPLEKLIMSKKLSRPVEEYKSKAPHVGLALRLMKEKPEIAPVSGDRVPFVIRSGPGGTSDRACTPEEIRSGKYSVDRKYYLEKQLMNPILRIMDRVIDNPQELFECRSLFVDSPAANSVFSTWERKRTKTTKKVKKEEEKKRRKTTLITNFFTFSA